MVAVEMFIPEDSSPAPSEPAEMSLHNLPIPSAPDKPREEAHRPSSSISSTSEESRVPLSSLQFPATSMQHRSIGDHQMILQTTPLFKPQIPSPPSQWIDARIKGVNLPGNIAWSTPSRKDHTILLPSISPPQCLFTTSLSQLEIPAPPISPLQHNLPAPLSQLEIPTPPISPPHHHLTALLSCLDIPAPPSSPPEHHFITPVSHLNIPPPPFKWTHMPLTPQPMADIEDSSGGQAY